MKPCPFCGSYPGENDYDWCDGGVFWIRCKKCGAKGPLGWTIDNARELWGNRPIVAIKRAEEAKP